MYLRRSLWYKVIVLTLALVLIVPALVACGGTEETTPTSTITATPTMVIPTATPTPMVTETHMPTITPRFTPAAMPIATPTPTPTPTLVSTSTPTATPTPILTPTKTPTPTPAPSFTLGLLNISPTETISGQQVQISTTVSNVGGPGTYRAELEIDGAVVDAKDVWVPSSDSRTVLFLVSKSKPGVYNVLLGDRRGSFTVANPPLHMTLDYIGVKNDHNSGGSGQIFLILLVDDGIQQINTSIPLEGASPMEISDYLTVPIGETYKNAFDSGSVGSHFNIAILAYHRIEQGTSYWGIIGQLADFFFPALGGLGTLTGSMINQINSQAPQYEYVGSYQGRWNDSNSWGIGQYNDVGGDDLHLWFRIWSDSAQQQTTPPTLVPNVVIQDVNVPTLVELNNNYTYNVTLRNSEDHPVTMTLTINSSVTGNVSTESVDIPADSVKTVSKQIQFQTAGVRTMTYTILKNGKQVDTLSKTVEAREHFAGWFKDGVKVTTANKGNTITARLNIFALPAGQYTMRIGRDISWAFDVTVKELSFYYDGIHPTSQELSFVPPYATGEQSTNGYWVDLLKDGSQWWTFADTYPPRLRVNPLSTQTPVPPCRIHGTVQIGGVNVPDGTAVTAIVAGDTYTATTPSAYGASTYLVSIAQPDGKSYAGQTITFMIGGLSAGQTAAWTEGGNLVVNLSIPALALASPIIIISPTSGPWDSSVIVTGSGFAADETGITVTYDTNSVATNITASDQGAWSTTFTVPASSPGFHTVDAYGSTTTAASVPNLTFTVPVAIHTGLDINSKIGDLMGNPDTKAVLQKWIPDALVDPQWPMAYGMTLAQVAPYSPATYTAEVMAGIAADLLAIK